VIPVVTAAVTITLQLTLLIHYPSFCTGQSLVQGIACGLIATLCYVLACTAWGQWLLFVRICLPLTGRLPWATMAFLEDAYRRGVLRQAGAVYQFRHARLQSHLDPASPE
jgi:hypothetical protein